MNCQQFELLQIGVFKHFRISKTELPTFCVLNLRQSADFVLLKSKTTKVWRSDSQWARKFGQRLYRAFLRTFFSMNTVHWTAFRVCDLRCCRFCNKIEILSSEKDQTNSDATLICPDWHMNNLISGIECDERSKNRSRLIFALIWLAKVSYFLRVSGGWFLIFCIQTT